MRIVFEKIPVNIELSNEKVLSLEISNHRLFAEICASLREREDDLRRISYSLWNGEKEVKPDQHTIFVESPLNLPWDDKKLNSKFLEHVADEINSDEYRRLRILEAVSTIDKGIFEVVSSLNANYELQSQWDMAKYLKMSHFSAELKGKTFFENQIEFLKFVSDSSFDGVVIFVTLQKFLTKNQLNEWVDQAIFLGLRTLLIEVGAVDYTDARIQKQVVDLLDCSDIISNSDRMDVSLQERFCDNGFGAVTF